MSAWHLSWSAPLPPTEQPDIAWLPPRSNALLPKFTITVHDEFNPKEETEQMMRELARGLIAIGYQPTLMVTRAVEQTETVELG